MRKKCYDNKYIDWWPLSRIDKQYEGHIYYLYYCFIKFLFVWTYQGQNMHRISTHVFSLEIMKFKGMVDRFVIVTRVWSKQVICINHNGLKMFKSTIFGK